MDFHDSATEDWTVLQDAALKPSSSAESLEMDFNAPISTDLVGHYPHLKRSKHLNHSSSAPVIMTTKESSAVIISRLKARQDLHLPPFKTLHIAAPSPNLLLTPPDDTDPFYWKPMTQFSTFNLSNRFRFPQSLSVSPQDEDITSKKHVMEIPASDSDAETSTPQAPHSQSPTGIINPQAEASTPSASKVPDFSRYGESAWVQEAVEVAGK